MSPSLASFPEELLARILFLSLAPPPRPAFDVVPPRNRIAPLLVSRQFFRIASPFLYHTLHFHSPHQVTRALDIFTHRPLLANAIRRVVFGGIWHDCVAMLALCDYVQDVDISLDSGPGGADDADAEAFCSALEQRRTIMHLTIRKDPAVYLTHPRPIYILQRLAQAVPHWTDLVSTYRRDPYRRLDLTNGMPYRKRYTLLFASLLRRIPSPSQGRSA